MNHEELREIYRSSAYTQEERVEASIKAFQHYMNTYNFKTCCCGNGNVFADDVLYMLGVALNPEEFSSGKGYSDFKGKLKAKLTDRTPLTFKGE